MDFRELNYVIAIAKYQNITKAAEALFVSQPTLSNFLKSLEADLGQKLFRKLGHRYLLTYAGEVYIKKASQILQLKSDLDLELADIIKKDIGVLKVALPTMRCTYMLPRVLPAFQQLHPNVKVQIYEGHSQELDEKILQGEAELAFYTQPKGALNPLLKYEVLGEEELLICTPKGHPIGKLAKPSPFSKYPKLDVSMLKDEQIVMMLTTQRTRQIVDEALRPTGIHFENVLYTSNMPAIIDLVEAGYGIAFVFEPHLRHKNANISVDCYSFGNTRTVSSFVVSYRKDNYLPQYAKDFILLSKKLCVEQ